jgi:tryptophanyl-tRNA synthetase
VVRAQRTLHQAAPVLVQKFLFRTEPALEAVPVGTPQIQHFHALIIDPSGIA